MMELSYHGLTSAQANSLLSQTGENVLPEGPKTSLLIVFLKQFNSLLVALLLLASAISFLHADFLDGSLILIIVLLNGLIGFFQENKAKNEVAALKKMVVPTCRVIRDGKEIILESRLLVPGDLVILSAGDKVNADGEVLVARSASVDEASLSGESVPVIKEAGDELFMGTSILSGNLNVRVTQTGERAKFGQIAKGLEEISDEKTPMERKIEDFGRIIGGGVIGLICLITLIGVLQGRDLGEMFFTGTALAVAAVPEGLPAILTIALTVGVSRLAKKKAIVKRLLAAEALGSVDVICTDKTGTLTKNQMSVVGINLISGKDLEVSGSGYSTVGEIVGAKGTPEKEKHNLDDILRASVLCNSSSLTIEGDHNSTYKVLGDTTEGALLILAKKAGIEYEEIRKQNPLTDEIPFDSDRKMMTVLLKEGSFSKGAPEEILMRSNNLGQKEREQFLDKAKELGGKGLRVLALAKKNWKGEPGRETVEKDLEFLGLVTIFDPPRSEVKNAVHLCREAGIKVVMITGDSAETARAVAEEVGIINAGEEVVLGAQLREYSEEILRENLENIKVFARVSPTDKLRIVDALANSGKNVAVTGDGVNDALAIKRAQVGVAMGMTGTDVAKEVADLVIVDDNFTTIVTAISEGRIIYSNLVKAIKYLLAGNFGEVLTVVVALSVGLPIPLSPLALLWINLVGDGLPALALAVDPKDGKSMSVRANFGEKFLGKSEYYFIGVVGVLQAAGVLLVYYFFLQNGSGEARIAAFSALVIFEVGVAFLARGKKNLFSNKYLIWATVVTLALQGIILLVPAFRAVFN